MNNTQFMYTDGLTFKVCFFSVWFLVCPLTEAIRVDTSWHGGREIVENLLLTFLHLDEVVERALTLGYHARRHGLFWYRQTLQGWVNPFRNITRNQGPIWFYYSVHSIHTTCRFIMTNSFQREVGIKLNWYYHTLICVFYWHTKLWNFQLGNYMNLNKDY